MKLSEHSPHLREEYIDEVEPFDSLTHASRKKVRWRCTTHGVEYVSSVLSRVNSHGCPKCSREASARGRSIAAQKSNPLPVELYNQLVVKKPTAACNNDRVEWLCGKGHRWFATPNDRSRKGSGCPYCMGKVVVPGETGLVAARPDIANEYAPSNPVSVQEISLNSNKRVEWYCNSGHYWFARVSDRTRKVGFSGCPHCSVHGISKAEILVADFVESLGVTTIRNSRQIISPKEIDIYVPEHNLAIEYNGVYWHTERIKGSTSHYDKYMALREKGIDLLVIWEDDWLNKPEVVKSMIRAKLGLSTGRIGARKTNVVTVSSDKARQLLNDHHIQGFANGTDYVGLEYNGELVAVGVFKKYRDTVYLQRYASTIPVTGGLDKMMKSLPYMHYTTFADNAASGGRLYESTGWTFDKELPPDYCYLVDMERQHKFNYRKDRFKRDESLRYEENLTERQLAELNGIERIYDYGKRRYTKNIELL